MLDYEHSCLLPCFMDLCFGANAVSFTSHYVHWTPRTPDFEGQRSLPSGIIMNGCFSFLDVISGTPVNNMYHHIGRFCGTSVPGTNNSFYISFF